jgi:hypothetical protein
MLKINCLMIILKGTWGIIYAGSSFFLWHNPAQEIIQL